MNLLPPQPIEILSGVHPRIRTKPMYYLQGFQKDPRVFLQKEAYHRLCQAADLLPTQYGLLLWDGYRSRACQATLFAWMHQEVQTKYPQLNEQQIEETTRKYVNPPASVGDAYCPPHLTGGAVDVTLFSTETEQEVEMGSPFDDCTEKAHALFYEHISPTDPKDFLLYRDRRRALREAMTQAGFTLYEYEWWHFDYGDIMWSRATGKLAFLSPLFGDQEGPGPSDDSKVQNLEEIRRVVGRLRSLGGNA